MTDQIHTVQVDFAQECRILMDRLAAAEARAAELEKLVYVPGQWRCAKCKYVGIHAVFCATTGNVGIKADTKTETCPNGCGPLWPVTERQVGNELCDRMDAMADKLKAAEARAERADAEAAVLLKALSPFARLGSLSAFHVDGVVRLRHGKDDGTTINYRCFRDANDAVCNLAVRAGKGGGAQDGHGEE